jgi:hypothetical protein
MAPANLPSKATTAAMGSRMVESQIAPPPVALSPSLMGAIIGAIGRETGDSRACFFRFTVHPLILSSFEKTATPTSSKMGPASAGSDYSPAAACCSLVLQSGRAPDRASAVERPETASCVKQAAGAQDATWAGERCRCARAAHVRQTQRLVRGIEGSGTRALRSVSFVCRWTEKEQQT